MNADPTQRAASTPAAPSTTSAGGPRGVLEAARSALDHARAPTLALVLETVGSTYVTAGAIALFDHDAQTGWLSGGCLEPEIARRAAEASAQRRIHWMEVDTRDDEALFGGAAVGCRGLLRLALLPLHVLDGWRALADRWLERRGPMIFSLSASGRVECSVGATAKDWQLDSDALGWELTDDAHSWQATIAAPPAVLVLGTGPEAAVLLPLLRAMGWMTTAIERRPRWQAAAALADLCSSNGFAAVLADEAFAQPFAALVMHHNFELDLEALLALSEQPPPFIGLLGPHRRREDLFKLMPDAARTRLLPHLHSPVGIDLGGRGPEAIAVSIAAQLQSKWHGR